MHSPCSDMSRVTLDFSQERPADGMGFGGISLVFGFDTVDLLVVIGILSRDVP